jgi:hypothetical protein
MGRQTNLPASLAPLGVPLVLAAEYLSLSPTKFQQLVDDGRMPKPKRIDGRLVYDLEEVRLAFKALPTVDDQEPVNKNTWEDIDNAT